MCFFGAVHVKDRCRLYCRVEHSSAYYLLKDKVADGTPCGPDTDDICVNGICKQASCNHVLGRKEQLGTSFLSIYLSFFLSFFLSLSTLCSLPLSFSPPSPRLFAFQSCVCSCIGDVTQMELLEGCSLGTAGRCYRRTRSSLAIRRAALINRFIDRRPRHGEWRSSNSNILELVSIRILALMEQV